MIPYVTTRETKMHSFQYRVLHRLITCNKYLHKLKICDDPKCTYCREEDTMVHFLIDCPPVQKFWTDLDDCSLNNLSVAEKLLGINSIETNNNNNERLQNWIILAAKFFIHREKLFNHGSLCLLAFLGEVRKKLYTEALAYQLEGRKGKFKKFRQLFQVLGGQI